MKTLVFSVDQLQAAVKSAPAVSKALSAPRFFVAIKRFFLFLRRTRTVPVAWNHACAVQLDKRNGKIGPDGLRLIFFFRFVLEDLFRLHYYCGLGAGILGVRLCCW